MPSSETSRREAMTRSHTVGVVCTVLGGALALWVVARLASATGWQQTWASPLTRYEWVTLGGATIAAGLLIVGLLRWTAPRERPS